MKKLLLVVTVSLLCSGCSLLQMFNMTFDSSEYDQINTIQTDINLSQPFCGQPYEGTSVGILYKDTLRLKNYTDGLQEGKLTIAIDNLYKMVNELDSRYDSTNSVSKTYCTDKLEDILSSTKLVQQAIAKEPRS
jgi:hypothetical protein